MRKVIADIAVSVDGFIESREADLDWLIFDEEIGFVEEFLSRFEVIFYGRVAYDRFGITGFGDDFSPFDKSISNRLNQMRKYVFTRSLKHVGGNGMVINHSIRENVQRIKEEEGKDIWLCGGAGIIKTFASLDLIDEYVLAIQPIILGRGKSLFNNLPRRINLKLLRAEALASGVVILNYQPIVKQSVKQIASSQFAR